MNEKYCNCEICVMSKHKTNNFPTYSSRGKEPLELVHTDIFGSMQTHFIGGSLYLFTFIDDYSKKKWVYFIKNKSNTLSRFEEFKEEEEK